MSDDAPKVTPPAAPPIAPITRATEVWAKQKKIPLWLFKAAAVGARWQIGEEFEPLMLPETDFDAAIAFAENPHAVVNPAKK